MLLLAAFALIVVGGIGLGVLTSGYRKTNGGEVGVVRNGGPLDNNRIRQVIDPASSITADQTRGTGPASTSCASPPPTASTLVSKARSTSR